MQFNLDMPRFVGSDSSDLKQIKNWLCRFSEQLGYLLSNLDGDNLSDDLKGELKGELEGIAASLKASADRLSADISLIKAELASKPSYITGRAFTSSSGEAAVTYGPLPSVPAITAIALSDSSEQVTVRSATSSGCVLCAPNAAVNTEILWTALY